MIAKFLVTLALAASLQGQTALNFVDRYSSTLSGSYTSGGSSLSVTSASGLPTGTVNFYALVLAEGGNTEELFHVTNVTGTTLTVTGAQGGTAASNHASTAVIIASIMSADAFQAMFTTVNSQKCLINGTCTVVSVAQINGIAVTGTPSVGDVPVAVSSSAATWQPLGSTTTVSPTYTAIADGMCQNQTVTWTGITAGSAMSVGLPSTMSALQGSAVATATNTVVIRLCNLSGDGTSVTPGTISINLALGIGTVGSIPGSGTVTQVDTGGCLSGGPITSTGTITTPNCVTKGTELSINAPSTSTTSYYVAKTGSDSNDCSSGSKCLTLGHVLGLLPSVWQKNYTINVTGGAGAYAEAIPILGFIGSPDYVLTIVGDVSTPSNVQFTGTTTCGPFGTSVACVSGNVWVTLSGIEVNATADMGIICNQCRLLTLDRTVTVGSYTNGVAIIDGSANLLNDNSIANFSTLGLAGVHAFIQQTSAGTVTITGGNTTATFCLNLEHGSQYSLLSNTATPAAANVTISNCFYGVLLGSSSLASVVSTGTFSVSNASTPSNSNGFWVGEHSTVDLTPEHLFVDHFTTCVNVVGLSIFQQGPGNRTTSNCTASATAQSSVYFVF